MINPIFLLDHFDYIHTLICAIIAIPDSAPLDDSHKDHGRAEAVADEGDPGGGRDSLIRKTSDTEEHPAENGLKNKRCYYKSIVLK